MLAALFGEHRGIQLSGQMLLKYMLTIVTHLVNLSQVLCVHPSLWGVNAHSEGTPLDMNKLPSCSSSDVAHYAL